jgi:hypothetical protein
VSPMFGGSKEGSLNCENKYEEEKDLMEYSKQDTGDMHVVVGVQKPKKVKVDIECELGTEKVRSNHQ